MASFTIEPKGNIFNNSSQICRLCMSKESLSDMYKEYGLHQWIEDYLSIMVNVALEWFHNIERFSKKQFLSGICWG